MENNLAYYKDNILSKLERNREIEKILAFIHINCQDKDELTFKFSKFSPKLTIKKDLVVDLLKSIKTENEKHIDRYLKLSFDSKTYYEEIGRKYNEINRNSRES